MHLDHDHISGGAHEHTHTHADGTVHTHTHTHEGDHDHSHDCAHDCGSCGSACEHTPMEELTALMGGSGSLSSLDTTVKKEPPA